MDHSELTPGQRRRAIRFAFIGNVIPIGIATASGFDSHGTVFFIGAAGACIAPVVVTALSRRQPIPFYLAAYGGLVCLTMLQAGSGGAASGYSILMLMAMLWFGVFASDRELAVAAGVLAACAYLPMLIFGPPDYPVEWGHPTLLVFIGCTVAGSLRALTRETEKLTAQLRHEAVIDPLTGLMNRRGWEDGAERQLAAARRDGTSLALVMIDLDHLKEINDAHGHDEGDRALREVADGLRLSLRASDALGRLGGDEFVALLADAQANRAIEAVGRAQRGVSEHARFSAGVAAWDGKESLEELVRRGDVALYAAKVGGGGRIETAGRSLEEERTARNYT
jgi:diguanylate cyclase (GGDEF)-like protein